MEVRVVAGWALQEAQCCLKHGQRAPFNHTVRKWAQAMSLCSLQQTVVFNGEINYWLIKLGYNKTSKSVFLHRSHVCCEGWLAYLMCRG